MTGRNRLPEVSARLPLTQAALRYAERAHAGQLRSSDGAVFIQHPLEVGWLLYCAGGCDPVVAAGLLHDVLEKTGATPTELAASFGPVVTALVCAVSEDPAIPDYEPRKAALRRQAAAAGPDALLVFAADKVSKVREVRSALVTARRRGEPVERSLAPARRLAHFRHCLGLLEEQLADAPLVALLREELAGLDGELMAPWGSSRTSRSSGGGSQPGRVSAPREACRTTAEAPGAKSGLVPVPSGSSTSPIR